VTTGHNHDETIQRVRERTTRLLDAIEASNDAEFIGRRLKDVTEELALATSGLVAAAAEKERNAPPDNVVDALRSRGTRFRSVEVEVHGIPRTLAVRCVGYADPAGEARRWQQLQEQLKGGAGT
jgi:hypothetical protein